MHPAHRTHSLFTTGHIAWIRSNSMTITTNTYVLVVLLALFTASSVLAQSQRGSSLSLSNDCSQISVDYENNPNLTAQEKIELMDKALLHSLNKYEGCQNIQKTSSNASSGGSSSAESGGDGQQGSAGNNGSGSSTASSTMTGTETPTAAESSDAPSKASNKQQQGSKSASLSGDTTAENTPASDAHAGNHEQATPIKGSGKTPGDIPAVDNDSVLEAQIRQAAMSESDPAIKARLWNEYRKYKGLPVRKP